MLPDNVEEITVNSTGEVVDESKLTPRELWANERSLLRPELIKGIKEILNKYGIKEADECYKDIQKLIGN